MTKNEKKWAENYELLKEYIAEHRQLPDKKKVEHRSLLNWWKYNRKLLTSSLRHPKILIKEFSYFLMPCHQHGLRINLLV